MIQILNCLRCGHEWASRKKSRPERCAKCTIKYWWRPKRQPKEKRVSAGIGRPRKYPVHLLKQGQAMTLTDDMGNRSSMYQCVKAYQRTSGRQFRIKESLAGLVVKRIK